MTFSSPNPLPTLLFPLAPSLSPPNSLSGNDWNFNSGASSHMYASSSMLSNFISSPFSSITLGDDSYIPISSLGHAQISSSTKPLLL
jgi:hypothetical protein